MSFPRDETLGEILLTREQFDLLCEQCPAGEDTYRMGPIPEDTRMGPTWAPEMNDMANSQWFIEEWTPVFRFHNGQEMIAPRARICGFSFAVEWFNDRRIIEALENIKPKPAKVEQESTGGLGLTLGALALVGGLAALKNKKKSSVSKEKTRAVQVVQEIVR